MTNNRYVGCIIEKRMKFEYAGQKMRKKDDKWSYKITVWTLYNRKKEKADQVCDGAMR